MTNTLANNAQLDKFKTELTLIDVLPPTALEDTKFNFHMTLNPAVDAKTANGQDSSQINSRLHVLLDHWLFAVADKSNQQMDTPVKAAQLAQSKAPLTLRFASDHNVLDNTKSLLPSTRSLAVPVRLANGHNTCQTLQELNASKDH
jgi:hypothetical protein